MGSYTEGRPGPLLICIAGIHGNEWAGVQALDLLYKMIQVEPITNPSFTFHGKVVFILGNLPALKSKTRYIDADLNRIWFDEGSSSNLEAHEVEYRERRILQRIISQEIKAWPNAEVVLLDLHTTTAEGGIFTLPTNEPYSIEIAKEMHAPVITGLVERLPGTLISYYTHSSYPQPITGIVFEGGQHDDPLSVNRCIAATINCMRTIGLVSAKHVVNRHDKLLVTYAQGLPKVAEFQYVHRLNKNDGFQMLPGFKNFQQVEQGMILAHDQSGPIEAQKDGLLLMPHYQVKGEDGFFLVKVVDL